MENSHSEGSHKPKRSSPTLISRKAISKRSPINELQVQHFCELCHLLTQKALGHFGVKNSSELPENECDEFTQLPEYELFTNGTYACGFVCSDFSPTVDLNAVMQRPEEVLARMTLPQLRHCVHSLMRSERAGYGYGSILYKAIKSGALEALCDRLTRDSDLYEDF